MDKKIVLPICALVSLLGISLLPNNSTSLNSIDIPSKGAIVVHTDAPTGYENNKNSTKLPTTYFSSSNIASGSITPSGIYANGTKIKAKAGTTAGSISIYANDSTTAYTSAYGESSDSKNVYYYDNVTHYENYVPVGYFSLIGAKKAYDPTGNGASTTVNNFTGNIIMDIEGGTYHLVYGDDSTTHIGNTTLNISGGNLSFVYGNKYGSTNCHTSGGITINVSGDANISSLAASYGTTYSFPDASSSYVINLSGNIKINTLWTYGCYKSSSPSEKVVNVVGKLADTASVTLKPTAAAGYITDNLAEGYKLVYAEDTSNFDNYTNIFKMTSYYQGTKGVIARSGHYLVYSYPASTVLAPTPVTSYSNGAISGLVANRKYLLTDSNGTKHYVTADSNGKIIISSTSNRDLAGLSITSLVTLRSSSEGSSETADSNAETVSYTLPSMQSTPASTFASASKISSLTPNETYELTDSKGNTHLVKANASGEIVLDDSTNRDLAGLTIKSIVHKGDDKKTIDSEQQLVSYTFKDKEITPTSSYDTNAITDLTPNTTYVLKDSNGNTHSVTSNASGQIVVDDNNNVSLAGLTIVGIAKVAGSSTICSDEQSVRYVLPSQYETPTSTFANNTISGLVAGETYVLTYNGGSKEVVADSNGKIVMDDSTNRDLAGLTITSLVHKTSNNHLSSPAQSGLSYNFGNKEVISPTPTYTTNTISGLVGGESYTLIDSDGVKHVVSATSDGKIVVDDTTNRDLAGLSIASIVKNGESGSISSDPTIFATPLVLPSKVATPSTTYDPDSKVISGLVVGQEYVFTFDDNTTYKFTATDTTFSVSDTSNRDLAGKTITKIVASGNGGSLICSDSQTVDDLLASKEVLEPLTLSYDQSQDTISGLKATTSYRLYYEGGYVDVTSDKDGKCDLSDYSELVGKTITSIAKVGSGSNVVSDPQVIDNYVVNKREEIPSTFKQEENGVLSGLKPGTAYILKDLNGNSYEVTSDKDGKINTYDIVGEDGLKIAGKTTLSSIEAVGDSSIPSINSKVKVLTSNIVIPTREVVGEISFDSTYGVLSGFKANEEYEITYTDSTGTLKKETIKANELGEINVLEHPELATSTISQVTKLGVVSKGTIDSQDKALSITIGTLETYASSTKSKAKSDLEKALKAIVSSSSVTDKDKVTDKVNPIISKAQEEIDKLTNDETLVSKVADIIEEAKKEAEFEVKREQGIETVTNLKRKCSDNDKINKAVDDAINDLNDLTYSTTSSSEVDTIVSKATDKVNLVIKQISLTNDVSSSFGDNPSSDEQALIDEYTKKIEGATSEEEAASIYKEFINAKTKLLNDKSSSKANGLMIACFVLFGIYLLFYVIYALLLKHHEFDGVHVVTMILYSVFLIIMSCLIKSNPGFIALGLSWFILASALGLTSYFTYKANKASKQDEASKHA